jgi:hypothetical protein
VSDLSLFEHEHGAAGDKWPVDLSHIQGLAKIATLSAWLLHLPNQALGWSYFQLALVHLAPVLGHSEPYRQYPEAEFELMMCALLSPPGDTLVPDPARPESTFKQLEPINYTAQFHGMPDVEARRLCAQIARAFIHGMLPAEARADQYVPARPHPGGLIVPNEPATILLNSVDRYVTFTGTGERLTAREAYTRLIWGTAEHYKTDGQHGLYHHWPDRQKGHDTP